MGFPFSRFSMLAGLCGHDHFISEKFSRFKAVCIVLHDPDDTTFTGRMRERFKELHEKTGNDMLFITFVEPSSKFIRSHAEADFSTQEKDNLYMEEGTDDRVIIGNFLRATMPAGDLPAILVTDDLSSGRFVYLPTSVRDFGTQLIAVGEYCTAHEGRFMVSDEAFLNILEKIGRPQLVELNCPLAQSLADSIALSEMKRRDSFFQKEAEEWAERRLEKLRAEAAGAPAEIRSRAEAAAGSYAYAIESARKPHKRCRISILEERDDWSIKGFSLNEYNDFDDFVELEECHYIRTKREKPAPSFYDKYSLDPNNISGYKSLCKISKDDIATYNYYLSTLFRQSHPSQDELDYIPGGVRRDYMPFVHYFADVMETEINLSLVQQMRQSCGIAMPEWFNRFKPNCTARVPVGKYRDKVQFASVNSDKDNNRILQPLMLGKAYYAYRDMTKPNARPSVPMLMGDSFMDRWNTLIKLRNTGEHTSLANMRNEDDPQKLDFECFVRAHKAFSDILAEDLQVLLNLKAQLSGQEI